MKPTLFTDPCVTQLIVEWGWSSTRYFAGNLASAIFQRQKLYVQGADISIDFNDAPENTQYWIIRYPKAERFKGSWESTGFNYGTMGDQVFDYLNADYWYVFSRVKPVISRGAKTVTLK